MAADANMQGEVVDMPPRGTVELLRASRDLFDAYGVAPPIDLVEMAPPAVERVSLESFVGDSRAPTCLSDAVRWRDPTLAPGQHLSPFVEEGIPGTPILAGQITVEPNPAMRPYTARGVASVPGVYEETLREPVVYKSYESIRKLLCTGIWDLAVPADTPEALRPRVEEATAWMWGRLNQIDGGWERLVEHLATCIVFGFSIFEIVWGVDAQRRLYPAKLAYREQSTVDRWLLDPDARHLAAVSFRAGSGHPDAYVLPSCGPSTQHHRTLLCTLAGRGLNFEGLPPTRPINLLVQYKKLLLAIMAASTERFGCPILMTEVHDGVYANAEIVPRESEWTAYFNGLRYMVAMQTPTLKVPMGLTARYLSPQGSAPDLIPLLNYLDQAIAQVFATQAQSLGHGQHGSYALAQVQDDDLTRAIPYYAQVISQPINDLVRLVLRKEWGLDLPHYPKLSWQARSEFDSSRWLEDVERLLSIKAIAPKAILDAALEKLGLPPDTFDATDEAL